MNQSNRRTPVKRTANQHAYRVRARRKKSIVPRAIFVFSSFTAILVLLGLVLGQHESFSLWGETDTLAEATPTPEALTAVAPTAGPTAAPTSEATPEPTEDPAILANILLAQEMLDDPFMILVSVDSIMPDGYVVDEVLADSTTGKTLDATAAAAYIDMAAAAASDGITIRLQSAYRSVSYQEGLFEAQIQKWIGWGYSEEEATVQAATVVNPPGASEHNCGLAADINCPEYYALEEGFEDTTAFAWLVENAADYGYILRYPKGDEDITGITYEPWHWRYVGAENAAIINESGLCFETFLIELAAVADGSVTSNAITDTLAWQATTGTVDITETTAPGTQDMTYEEAVKAGLDPEALGLTP